MCADEEKVKLKLEKTKEGKSWRGGASVIR